MKKSLKEKFRPLKNPTVRGEIPKDFPRIMHITDMSAEQKAEKILTELEKRGGKDVKRITIVYPHKHAGLFPEHNNSADTMVTIFKKQMERAAPHIEWVVADAICETRHLDRSGNQSVAHAITGQQIFDVYMPAQKTPLPFLDPANKQTEYFVMVDNDFDQGTTLATLMSYIHYNGGVVLAGVAAGVTPARAMLAQSYGHTEEYSPLSGIFNEAGRNNSRSQELGQVFSKSTRHCREFWSPQRCLDELEAALNLHGKSIVSLTDGECRRMVEFADGSFNSHIHIQSFVDMLKRIATQETQPTTAEQKSAMSRTLGF